MQRIPKTIMPFFQEYNFAVLDLERDIELILERVLQNGNREEVRWLLHYYGNKRVKQWIAVTGSRRLSKRRYHLWCVLLDVKETLRKTNPIWPY
jgi:hypothetical protein